MHNSAAFLQLDGANMQGVASTLQYQLARHQELFEGVLTHTQRKTTTVFIQAPCTDAGTPSRLASCW